MFNRQRLADERDGGRFQIAATRRDSDQTGLISGTHSDTVDAALDIEELIVDGIYLPLL